MARVLIVDDGPFMRNFIKSMLLDREHEVVGEAENGQEAIEKYMELQPDLITLDITMPVMDGLKALRVIKEYNPSVKVIMISASGQEDNVKEAIRNGASSFLMKPFTADTLYTVLDEVLNI